MKVVVMSKNTFSVTTLTNVSNIAYASGIYSITSGGTTTTYAADDYNVSILW